MLQDSASLFDGNAREPLYELVYRGIVFEVLEERCDRHTRTTEYPRAAQDSMILFHSGARRPINHANNRSTGGVVQTGVALPCDDGAHGETCFVQGPGGSGSFEA